MAACFTDRFVKIMSRKASKLLIRTHIDILMEKREREIQNDIHENLKD